MSRATTRTAPESVRTRKRYILLADAYIGLSILNAVLHFTLPGVSNVAWMILGLGTAAGTFALRRSIGNTDLPTAADVALFFGKLAFIQLIWVPFAVTRSMAGKINRDELVSAE